MCEVFKVTEKGSIYSTASILVNPKEAPQNVCPTPHTATCHRAITSPELAYTKDTAALVTAPVVSGVTTPIKKMMME